MNETTSASLTTDGHNSLLYDSYLIICCSIGKVWHVMRQLIKHVPLDSIHSIHGIFTMYSRCIHVLVARHMQMQRREHDDDRDWSRRMSTA